MTTTRDGGRGGERGAAMMVTLIMIASLMAGAAALVAIQTGTNRSTELTRSGMTAEYCAEAGAARAMPLVVANAGAWTASLCTAATEGACLPVAAGGTGAEPAILQAPAVDHDLDGDGVPDFVVYLRDDDDELTNPQDYSTDRDQRIYVVSTCIKYPDTVRQVKELVQLVGGGTNYGAQKGGCDGRGNCN